MKNIAVKLSTVAVATLMSQGAFADVIKCTFTEPFINTEYSMAQQTLTVIDDFTQYPKKIRRVIKNVSFQIKGPGQFVLLNDKKKVVQNLTLSFKGSNGMSDTIYPYEVIWYGHESMANGGHGGCSSNYLKTTEPIESN